MDDSSDDETQQNWANTSRDPRDSDDAFSDDEGDEDMVDASSLPQVPKNLPNVLITGTPGPFVHPPPSLFLGFRGAWPNHKDCRWTPLLLWRLQLDNLILVFEMGSSTRRCLRHLPSPDRWRFLLPWPGAGTGKTTTAELISSMLPNYRHVNVGDVVREKGLHHGRDQEFDAFLINEDAVVDELEEQMVQGRPFAVEVWTPVGGDWLFQRLGSLPLFWHVALLLCRLKILSAVDWHVGTVLLTSLRIAVQPESEPWLLRMSCMLVSIVSSAARWSPTNIDGSKMLDRLVISHLARAFLCLTDVNAGIGGNIIDFHSCDFFPERWIQLVIVLRTDNSVLYQRLQARNYSVKKVTENIEAEILQVVLDEARDSYDNRLVWELDSNNVAEQERNAERIVEWIKSRMNGECDEEADPAEE